MTQGADGPFIRIRHAAIEVVMESASLKSVKIIISRTSLQERLRAAVFHELVEDTSAALHHEPPQADVRSTSGRRVEKEFSEKQDMQDSRYVISPITAWSWMQSVLTRSTRMADQEVGSSLWDTETIGRG